MNRRISSALITILLLWIGTPALACLAQPAKMTDAEMQCCRAMAGDCGAMANAEHSCCPKTPARAHSDKVVLSAALHKYVAPVLGPTAAVSLPLAASATIKTSPPLPVMIAESPPGAPLPLRI